MKGGDESHIRASTVGAGAKENGMWKIEVNAEGIG